MRVVKMQGVKTAANRASKKAKEVLVVDTDRMGKAGEALAHSMLSNPQIALGPHADTFENHKADSNVRKAAYSVLSRTLMIWFKSGVYRYDGVKLPTWLAFRDAPSKGSFVQQFVIGPDRKNPIIKGERIGDA